MSGDLGGPAPGPADDFDDADPGLARQRTEMAWTRSAIAFLALGVAILKFRPAIGIPILAIAAAIWLLGRGTRINNPLIASRRVLLVTIAVNALAVVCLVLTLAAPSTSERPEQLELVSSSVAPAGPCPMTHSRS